MVESRLFSYDKIYI